MKKNLAVLSAVAAFILMSSLVFAGTGVSMNVDIPFDFYAGDQLIQAGAYTFEIGSGRTSAVTIRSEQKPGMIFLTVPGGSGAGSDQLQFNRYGKKHFLNTVAIRGVEVTFKTPKQEKELRAQMQAQSTILVAQK